MLVVAPAVSIFVPPRAAHRMNSEPDLQQKCALLAGSFKKSGIPHADKLVQKLSSNPSEYFLNAIAAWVLHKGGTYAVTDLEVCDGTLDITIHLNHDISIQSCGELPVFEDSGYKPTNKARARAERDQNRRAAFEKLGRLPNDKIGILLAWSEFVIPGLGDLQDVPSNKCVLNIEGATAMYHVRERLPWTTQGNLSAGNAAMVYHAPNFQGTGHLYKIADMLGYPATACIVNNSLG